MVKCISLSWNIPILLKSTQTIDVRHHLFRSSAAGSKTKFIIVVEICMIQILERF
jgi:hypothetical protein